MPVSPYIRQLRESIGHGLILLPSVAVLAYDDDGRLLLVRQADTGRWGTIGGSVEVDEDPAVAAVREAAEEAGVRVELTGLVTALGGPQFRLTYPNGDQTSYVSLVYEAKVVGGSPRPDNDETVEVGWFGPDELGAIELGDFARQSFTMLGLLPAAAVGTGERAAAGVDGQEAGTDHASLLGRLRASYDAHADDRVALADAGWKQAERERFATHLREAGTRSVLEIGAGHGVSGRYLADIGFDVTCVDLSPALVARCRLRGLPARVMDFGSLDFLDGSFDAVFGMNCLLHVPRARLPSVLAEVRRVLDRGGLFYWGQYIANEPFEGIWADDHYTPKRFFSFVTSEELLGAGDGHFDLLDDHRVRLDQGRRDFASVVLRAR